MILNPYANMREVLYQALQCSNPQVFYRVLIGYAKDDKFWEYAEDWQLELLVKCLELVTGIKPNERD